MAKRASRNGRAAQWLGASKSFSVKGTAATPFAARGLAAEIQTRLVSRGGRPSQSGTKRRLVPVTEQLWSDLQAQARSLSSQGSRAVSPGQLAALLIEKGVARLGDTIRTSAKRSRPVSRRSRAAS